MIYNFPDHINGDTFKGVQFEVLINSVPLNLTGAIIKMQLRLSPSGINFYEFSTVNSKIEIFDAAAGKFRLKKQLIEVEAKKYVYDIEITLPTNEVYTYISGSWTILESVTRG
jgi:hypothetical protein